MPKFLIKNFILFLLIFYANLCVATLFTVPAGNTKILQNILLKARANDTVVLSGGVYNGNFIIHSSITFTSKEGAILTSTTGSTLLINAPKVSVSHITFKGSGSNLSNKDSCIYVKMRGNLVQIQHNVFKGCLFGIWLNGVHNAHVSYNTLTGRLDKIISNRGNDIQLWYNTGSLVEHNTISKGRDGIYISNSKHVFVRNNKMNEVRFGVHFMYNNQCTFHNNKVTNSLVGLALMYSDTLIITENDIKFNRDHGYLLRQVNSSQIINNKAEKNADGIFIGGSYSNQISGNVFSYNKYGVVITSGSKLNKVFNNNFFYNTMEAKYLNNSPLYWGWKGRGNYWSGYKTFKSVNGVGIKPYHVTSLADWLVGSYPILNLILNSPVMGMLKKIENEFPVFQRASLIDKYPLISPYYPLTQKKSITS